MVRCPGSQLGKNQGSELVDRPILPTYLNDWSRHDQQPTKINYQRR